MGIENSPAIPAKDPFTAFLPEGTEYDYHPKGYLWYVLSPEKFERLPTLVAPEGVNLRKKSEFHVTVINARGTAREIAERCGDDPVEIEKELLVCLTNYIKEHPIGLQKFRDDLRLAKKDDRVSVAARCVMENVEGYFELLRAKYQFDIPTQPAHVSIYTGTGSAVGIDSEKEMEAFQKVELPEVQEVLETAV